MNNLIIFPLSYFTASLLFLYFKNMIKFDGNEKIDNNLHQNFETEIRFLEILIKIFSVTAWSWIIIEISLSEI